jgi:hypothetical protein
VTKKLLSSAIVLAVAIAPSFASAKKIKAEVETPNITAAKGSEDPTTTDVGHLSRKNPRDFVRDPTGISGAATLGFGSNDYGVGFGLRGGYTFPFRLYVGGIANYHFGNDSNVGDVRNSTRVMYFGPEAGYDLGVGKVILRPVLGLGLAFRNEKTETGGVATVDNNMTRVYVAPGASVILPIGNFFVGADSRYMINQDNGSITLLGAAGAHL